MQVVIVDVKALLSVSATRAPEGGMKNLTLGRRFFRFGDDDNDFGVGVAFMKQPTYGDEVEDLPDIPAFHEFAAEGEGLLVVKKIVLLEHAEDAARGEPLHGFVEEKVGELFVGQCAVLFLIAVVGALCSIGTELGGEWRVADDDADSVSQDLALESFEEAAGMNGFLFQRWKEFDAGSDLLGFERIA